MGEKETPTWMRTFSPLANLVKKIVLDSFSIRNSRRKIEYKSSIIQVA